MTENDIECGHNKTTLHVRGVNKSRKIITFYHLNATNFNDNFNENFFSVICVFSSSSSLGAFSSCFLMRSFTSLSVAPLVYKAISQLNH